jgi:response regulator NasT
MTHSLRIAVADDEAVMQEYYRQTLPTLGHEVAFVAPTGRALIEHCRVSPPHLIITDIKLPDMNGIDAVAEVCRDTPLPVILVSGHHNPEFIERASAEHILAYLVKPVTRSVLQTEIGIVIQRFQQFQALHRETADLRQALEDRKIIERAKGILMRRLKLEEPEAFRRLQKMAMDKNLKLIEIARMILSAEELLPSADNR